MIYWFTGASTQAVTTGAYRAVEFIKANINLEGVDEGVGRGQQEGRRDLHEVRAEGHVQHLPHRVLRDARVRVRRAVLLHRLSDLDRAVRAVPGDLHGQRRRRVGQREEDRRGRAEAERHASCTPRRSSATRSAIRSRTRRRSRSTRSSSSRRCSDCSPSSWRCRSPSSSGARLEPRAGGRVLPHLRCSSCTGRSTACASSARSPQPRSVGGVAVGAVSR